MNKGLVLAAFAVMLAGAFAAVQGAGVSTGATGKYTPSAGNALIEGGNVTEANLTGNSSTEKWAGFYGNVSAALVLQQSGTVPAMYVWTWDPTNGGEVCATTGAAFDWTSLAALTGVNLDTIWDFAAGDTDSGNLTWSDGTANYDIEGQTGATTGVYTLDNSGAAVWQSMALNDGTAVAAGATSAAAFCVNMSTTDTFSVGGTGAYQLMVATNETAATYETYNFYVELN